MSKIYTRAGDQGQTRLIGGSLVSKGHQRLEAYGDVDELNSSLGLIRAIGLNADLRPHRYPNVFSAMLDGIEQIQNHLFFIGSQLACEDESWRGKLPQLSEQKIVDLEHRIDEWTALLPPLREFILPGGHPLAAEIHMARTICRRAERSTARLMAHTHEGINDGDEIKTPQDFLEIRYLNRLSDYLFTAARLANLCFAQADQTWKKDV